MQSRLWAFAVISLALGCTPAQEPVGEAATAAPQISIRHPCNGAAVADTVTIRLAIDDPAALHRLALIVDGRTAEERYQPPWVFIWDTAALADSSWHILQVAAGDASGHSRLSDSCRVRVFANHPPEVEILWPPMARWLDLDHPGAAWHCRVTDPDEGSLPDTQVHWRLDGLPLTATGTEIPQPALSPGTHQVTARACDRWQRWGEAEVTIHGFRYPGAESPQAALETFLCALRAGDAATALAQLAPGFASLPPEARSVAEADGPQAEALALHRLLAPEHLRSLQLDAAVSGPELLTWGSSSLAQVELTTLDLLVRWRCSADTARTDDGRAAESPVRELQVRGSAARIGLRCLPDSAGGSSWRLWIWRDLHGACWSGSGGRSWSEIKRLSREQQICL